MEQAQRGAPLPLALSVTVGSGLFGGWQVRWDGDRLVYDRLGRGFTREAQEELWPSDADWARFWADLERVGVWAWRPLYLGDGDDDDTWEVRVALPDRRVESRGRGARPGAAEEQGSFAELVAALARLLGGRALPLTPG